MKHFVRPALGGLLLSSLLLQSCATLIAGSKQAILVSGQPEGCSYYVNDQPVIAKPVAGGVKIKLPRKRNSEIKVKHEGYKDYNELLTPNGTNGLAYLNLLFFGSFAVTPDNSGDAVKTVAAVTTGLGAIVGGIIDVSTGAGTKLSKGEIHPVMMRLPRAVAGGPTVQAGAINVRIKGGEKMGNFFIANQPSEILYFGKSLDVDADHLKADVNGALKDLGYNVPGSEGKSVFSTGSNSRYTLQGEMRDVKYDVHASNQYEIYNHYDTQCKVEVTWKLLGGNRQTILEQKTEGSSIKFEKGGSAAFEDAFENSLYTFLSKPEVVAVLTKVSATTAADDKPAPIVLRRAVPAKMTGDNGVSQAARNVVIIETADGHGSGCVVSANGYVVTNAHVVGDESEVKVLMGDGVSAKGKVVRVNAEMDLALVKIDAEGLSAFALPTASAAEVGTDVFAIGAPADKELSQTVTKGIVSGRRKVEGHTLIQTDVSINGGNSGGALVARSGQLLGIVNAKLVGTGIEGIGFAIPAEQVADALQLKFTN